MKPEMGDLSHEPDALMKPEMGDLSKLSLW
jgi:hypothetical protein